MATNTWHRPVVGRTFGGVRPLFFDYWRVGYGDWEEFTLDFWVEQTGEYHGKPNHFYEVHEYQIERWTRVYYEVVGEALVQFDKTAVLVRPGDLLRVPPRQAFVHQNERAHRYH